MTLSFEKIHASGNDFVLLSQSPPAQQIAPLCHRQLGIGADGIMVWAPHADGVQLQHYDPDGSRSLCLNGTRASLGCLVRQDKIPQAGTAHIEGHHFPYRVEGPEVSMWLPLHTYEKRDWAHEHTGFYCNVGNEHYILFSNMARECFAQLAPKIRADLASFPKGTNVHLVQTSSDCFNIYSYERGVEDFTLACGSGMYAAALVALGEAFAQQLVFSPEGPDRVRFRQEAQSLIMTGNIAWVASGVYQC